MFNTPGVGGGQKYNNLLRKNVNIRGQRWKNGGKGEFSLYFGEKCHFGKMRKGQKYYILGNIYSIHPCNITKSGKRIYVLA